MTPYYSQDTSGGAPLPKGVSLRNADILACESLQRIEQWRMQQIIKREQHFRPEQTVAKQDCLLVKIDQAKMATTGIHKVYLARVKTMEDLWEPGKGETTLRYSGTTLEGDSFELNLTRVFGRVYEAPTASITVWDPKIVTDPNTVLQ